MNEEQLKQLKPGDEIFIRARYKKTYADGDVCFSLPVTSVFGERAEGEGHTLPGNVILPLSAPKYDPCRLFKKGDMVRIVKYAGRCYTTFWESFVGVEMYVETSETAYSLPEVETAKGLQPIDPAYLELVTPVEELNPYSVHESEVMQGFDIVRDKLCVECFPFGAKECGWYYNRLAAKEAAEAECARLNAEYRKEQK